MVSLTESEQKLIEAMRDSLTVKDACDKIGISPRTGYTILYRLRKKYHQARRFVNLLDSKRRGNELLSKVLRRRYKYKVDEEEALES